MSPPRLTEAQRRALIASAMQPSTKCQAHPATVRSLERRGLVDAFGLRGYHITPAGWAALGGAS